MSWTGGGTWWGVVGEREEGADEFIGGGAGWGDLGSRRRRQTLSQSARAWGRAAARGGGGTVLGRPLAAPPHPHWPRTPGPTSVRGITVPSPDHSVRACAPVPASRPFPRLVRQTLPVRLHPCCRHRVRPFTSCDHSGPARVLLGCISTSLYISAISSLARGHRFGRHTPHRHSTMNMFQTREKDRARDGGVIRGTSVGYPRNQNGTENETEPSN